MWLGLDLLGAPLFSLLLLYHIPSLALIGLSVLLPCSYKEWLIKRVWGFCLELSYPGIYTAKDFKMLTFKLGFFLLV